MTTRYIITFSDLVEFMQAGVQYAGDIHADLQESIKGPAEKIKSLEVPANAVGFYVIDDNGDAKCVSFPE